MKKKRQKELIGPIATLIAISIFLLYACSGDEPTYERRELSLPFSYEDLPSSQLPSNVEIERDAIVSGDRDEVEWKISLIDDGVGLVRAKGWRCDSVSAVQPFVSKRGFILRCNDYSYVYEFEDRGGTWSVSLQ